MDERTRKSIEDLKSLTKYLFAVLSGAIVLFPSIFGAFRPPYVNDWALIGFWLLGVVGMLSIPVAFYLANYRRTPPHVPAGIGTLSTVFALICLGTYVVTNVLFDRISEPQMISVTASPVSAEPGGWVTLSADAMDEDGDRLEWVWEVEEQKGIPKELPINRKVINYRVPANASGEVVASVSATDDSGKSAIGSVIISVKGKKMDSERLLLDNYIKDSVRLHSARILRNDSNLKDTVVAAMDELIKSAQVNVSSLEALQNDPDAIREAMDVYFEIPAADLKSNDWRPCCKEWPGIWPFCNPDC